MFIMCHYGEIALKGGNRKFFEEKLVENIKKSLLRSCGSSEGKAPKINGPLFEYVKRISGRIIVKLKEEEATDLEKAEEALKNVFGIAYFCFAEKTAIDIKVLSEKAVEMLADREFTTFRVTTSRSDKNLKLTSQKVNEQVGAYVLEKLSKKVKLNSPDITLFIELVEKQAFLYTQKIAGLGGLPAGVSGRAFCLLSGGIDSPVAAFYAIKRGVEVDFVHFHSHPYTGQASITKVKDLARVLNNHQFHAKIYLVPFADIQKEILLNTKASLRVVLYRRFMFKIAQELAKREGMLALITGEDIGQVASQTLPNILAIEDVVSLPVLRPLIGFDKQEIIEEARRIGTYEISISPHRDCCSRFLPKYPATRANLAIVKDEEKKLAVKRLIEIAIKKTKIETV